MEYAACFTQVKFIDESGAPYDLPEGHPYKLVFKKKNRSREEWLNNLFWNLNCFCNPSVLFRNERENLALNACLWQLPDFYMWLNLCKRRNVYVLERELINFRLRRENQNSVSSLSLGRSIRVSNETYFTAREFFSLTGDAQEFMKIFPEAQKYSVGGEILPDFALAKLCLEHHLPAYQKLGLEKIYELMGDARTAAVLKKLYGYDEKNFMKDTGAVDVFGIKFQVPLLHSCLYVDFGAGFNEEDSLRELVQIGAGGAFSARFICPIKSSVKRLRFDPDDKNLLLIRLTKILVNGIEVKNFSSNAQKILDDYHLFLSKDPWFVINCATTGAALSVEIFGVVEQNPLPRLEKLYSDMDKTIQSQAEQLDALKPFGTEKVNGLTKALNSLKESIKKILG